MNLDREKAIEAVDAMVAAGYSATMHAGPAPGGYVWPHPVTGEVGPHPLIRVALSDMGYREVDLIKLIELAGGLGLEVRYSQAVLGFHLVYPDASGAAPVRTTGPSSSPLGLMGRTSVRLPDKRGRGKR